MCLIMQVDDIIRTYKNDNHTSSLMREEANANMVRSIAPLVTNMADACAKQSPSAVRVNLT